MADILRHHFVSAKAESSDSTLVSKNEWNEGHDFTSGINGQILIYDTTQVNNIRWTDGPAFYAPPTVSIPNPTSSPFNNAISLAFSSNTAIIIRVALSVFATTSGSALWSVELRIDGVTIATISTVASGATAFLFRSTTKPAGAHVIAADLETIGSVNFTGGTLLLNVDTIGV